VTAAGDLNSRLTLQAPVETDDGQGGITRAYETVATLWAQVVPLAGRADVAADSLGAALRHRIIVRARDDITTRHRFVDGARIYRMIAVRQSADRRFLEIDAEEHEDSRPDAAHSLPSHRYPGIADPLHEGPHERPPGSDLREKKKGGFPPFLL
jgi:SPP1 family predicted phage head-tail adaptor